MAKSFTLEPFNDGVLHTRNLILRGICAIYLCAFSNFYYQSEGLFGKNGILPAYIQFGESHQNGIVSAIHKTPTLLHFSSYLGLNVDYMMDLLSLLGILISFTGFISQTFCTLPTFAALWSLYYSLIQVTQIFSHQSDLLLLEAGFLCLIIAPLNNTKTSNLSDKTGIILLKWLLLRFMFDSGAVKFFSGCPQWWRFLGLSYHFETLPLPTPVARYCHFLPKNFLKATTIFTNISELICPWFFFFPSKLVRIILFYWEFYLQFCVIISGNYGILNYLVIVLLLSLLYDEYIKSRSILRLIYETFIAFSVFTLIIYLPTVFFEELLEELTFKQEHIAVLRSLTKLSPLVAVAACIGMFFTNVAIHPAVVSTSKGFFKKFVDINTLIAFTICSVVLIGVSIVPHNNLDSAMNLTNTQLGKYFKAISKYNIVNEYGQHLRRMRTERFELTLEYAEDVNDSWTEMKFVYKPWNIKETLPYAGPYLPRLDMKFYDAAPETYRDNLWILALAYRILQNEPKVLNLLGYKGTKLTTGPPKYVRAILNKFKYTSLNRENYWMRKVLGEYFPAFSLDNPTFITYLKSYKLRVGDEDKFPEVKNFFLKTIFDFIRSQVMAFDGHIFVISILLTGFVIIFVKK